MLSDVHSPVPKKISHWELETMVLNFVFSQAGKNITREEILSGADDLIKSHGWDPEDFKAKKIEISPCKDDSDV